MSGEENENMLLDALRWNMLNVIRVELFFDLWSIWDIFIKSSLQSPMGQRAIMATVITLIAQFAAQFNIGWLLSIYAMYLSVGLSAWLYRRVYFYHRRLDSFGVNQTIHNFDTAKATGQHYNNPATNSGGGGGGASNSNSKHDKHGDKNGAQSSSSSAASSVSEHTNSLQRQRVCAYRNFQSVLRDPRQTYREFALSMVHLSHLSKLIADEDVFDEMHFQILATRRDVVNLVIRLLLLFAANTLAYFR